MIKTNFFITLFFCVVTSSVYANEMVNKPDKMHMQNKASMKTCEMCKCTHAPKKQKMMMKMMSDMRMKELGEKDADYEKRFINLMIHHHEDGIKMAQDALKKSNKSELKEMATRIIVTQEEEIAKMKQWYKKWYGKNIK